MKAQILKIAGVKNQKEFYKLFPDEASFMKKHGKKFKKALRGKSIEKANAGANISSYMQEPKSVETTGPDGAQEIVGQVGPWGKAISAASTIGTNQTDKSGNVGVYTAGKVIFNPAASLFNKELSAFDKGMGWINPVYGGVKAFEAKKEREEIEGKQKDLNKAAMESVDVDSDRQISDTFAKRRKSMMPVNTGEEFFPIYGVGTNALAKDGYNIPSSNPNFLGKRQGGEGARHGEGTKAGNFLRSVFNPKANNITDEDRFRARLSSGMFSSQGIGTAKNGAEMESNGELEVYDGDAETLSTNPYLPDGGETVQFKGPSHNNGGMDITYGNTPVEVEGGEPAVKLLDEKDQGRENLVVFGDLQIPKNMLSDPKSKGKKFKNYIKDISKKEATQNKTLEKASKALEDFKPITSFDKLKMASYEANIKGANMKLKEYAGLKQEAAALQSAINDTAEEQGLVASELAKGKYKIDKKTSSKKGKYGIDVPSAFEGMNIIGNAPPEWDLENIDIGNETSPLPDDEAKIINTDIKEEENLVGENTEAEIEGDKKISRYDSYYLIGLYDKAKQAGTGPDVIKFQEEFSRIAPETAKRVLAKYPVTNYGKSRGLEATDLASNQEGIFGDRTEEYRAALGERPTIEKLEKLESKKTPKLKEPDSITEIPKEEVTEEIEKKKFDWKKAIPLAGSILQNFLPSDAEDFDPSQLNPEMYALANNQLEPVQAQTYKPQLDVPYDVSFQDQLNEVTASSRTAQRMAGYNPAMQAMIAGQAGESKSKILAEQFRANQAMKDRVYSGNRATMDAAQLKNLSIFDQQYVRQTQAKSKTKEATLAALSSMTDKFAKHKLENRTLRTYENLYNYRYNDKGRAISMNFPAQFDTSGIEANEEIEGAEERATRIAEEAKAKAAKIKKDKISGRNGAIIKALKSY